MFRINLKKILFKTNQNHKKTFLMIMTLQALILVYLNNKIQLCTVLYRTLIQYSTVHNRYFFRLIKQ